MALDLLQKMCHVDPEKRITAKESLRHPFFTEIEENEMVIEEDSDRERFQEYHQQQNNLLNKGMGEVNSLIIRNPIINGRTDTIKDSINSQGVIASFKSMSNPKNQNEQVKRESILKFVLMQN